MENLICEYYDFSGGYSTGNDGSHGMRYPIPSNYTVIEDNGYWKLQKVTSRSLLASFFNFVQTPSDHESVATGSNATASNATATDSNASGLPEGTAKAAIPMAAVLFGLMYAVPRLLPNDRKRERKER